MLFDTPPATLTQVYGDRVPRSMLRWIRRYRSGTGAFKLDYALSEPIPWTSRSADGQERCMSVEATRT